MFICSPGEDSSIPRPWRGRDVRMKHAQAEERVSPARWSVISRETLATLNAAGTRFEAGPSDVETQASDAPKVQFAGRVRGSFRLVNIDFRRTDCCEGETVRTIPPCLTRCYWRD